MRKWEKATFIIKPQYGYGKEKVGKIPQNSTLLF